MMGLDDAKPRNFIEIACGPVGTYMNIHLVLRVKWRTYVRRHEEIRPN
jgi:hypothetical protein